MFFKKILICTALVACACLSGMKVEENNPYDEIILITGDTLTGYITQLSDAGTITLVSGKNGYQRIIDKRFVNQAMGDGTMIYRRKNQVRPYLSLTEGQCAVFAYSRELKASILSVFPDLRERLIETNYNNELLRSTPELLEEKVDQVPLEHQRLKKIFDAYALASGAIICLVEPTDGTRVRWHFLARKIEAEQVQSFIHGSTFWLFDEYFFRSGDTKISNSHVAFTMAFSGIDSCNFIQQEKSKILKYRVIPPSSIGFTTYGRKNDSETEYEVVFISGELMRYSTFFSSDAGFITRGIKKIKRAHLNDKEPKD